MHFQEFRRERMRGTQPAPNLPLFPSGLTTPSTISSTDSAAPSRYPTATFRHPTATLWLKRSAGASPRPAAKVRQGPSKNGQLRASSCDREAASTAPIQISPLPESASLPFDRRGNGRDGGRKGGRKRGRKGGRERKGFLGGILAAGADTRKCPLRPCAAQTRPLSTHVRPFLARSVGTENSSGQLNSRRAWRC